MKKIFLALMCIACFASCTMIDAFKYSEEINDGTISDYDRYPGMNVNTEPLTGKVFTWPSYIIINNVITGEQNQSQEEDQDADMKITNDMFGSGLFVIVTLTLENTSSQEKTLLLPRGLLLQSASSYSQNGILVKDVEIPFEPKERRVVSVRFYCLNSSLSASTSSDVYGIGYITNIPAFEPLFNVCEGKKLNINQYKSSNLLSYYGACTSVQEIVWAITKGKTFTEAEIKKYLKHVKKG